MSSANLDSMLSCRSLDEVLSRGFRLPASERHPHVIEELVQQDEFTHDVIVPVGERWLVYDAT